MSSNSQIVVMKGNSTASFNKEIIMHKDNAHLLAGAHTVISYVTRGTTFILIVTNKPELDAALNIISMNVKNCLRTQERVNVFAHRFYNQSDINELLAQMAVTFYPTDGHCQKVILSMVR